MQKITFYERERIEVYLRLKRKKKWIAEKLGRDYSIIKREIKRNSGEHLPYKAVDAQYFTKRRARNTNKRKLDKYPELRKYVEDRIEDDWSPEQIADRLKEKPPPHLQGSISHESIYDYVYNSSEKYKQLYQHLRVGRKQRQRRFSRKKQGNKLKNRTSIHLRPEEINNKKEYGHWETDLVEFKKQRAKLSVKYERKSMLCRLHKISDKSALENEDSLARTLEDFPKVWFKTITRDNGGENARHLETLENFDVPSYFCDPYCSWQKGGIENLNKLIRQYFPKNGDIENASEKDILLVQEKLNNRPRKSINYLTPNEIFAKHS